MKKNKTFKFFFGYIGLVIYEFGITFLLYNRTPDWSYLLGVYLIHYLLIVLSYRYVLGGFRNAKFRIKNLIYIIFAYLFYTSFAYIYFYKIVNKIVPNYFSATIKEFYYYYTEYFFHYILFAFLYWFYRKTKYVQEQLIIKQQQNFELEQQKLQAEYNYLKTQINPHFLYNTLNFFVSKTMQYDESVSNGLGKLTSIMRYSLMQTNSQSTVLLQDELINLDNYIDLQKLRYANSLQMSYNKTGVVENVLILPHLLITLVENAFKHGNTRSTEQPLIINLLVDKENVEFKVTNAIDKVKTEQKSTSLGLQNLKTRLELVYKKGFELDYKEVDAKVFIAYLKIPIIYDNVNNSTSITPTIPLKTDGQLNLSKSVMAQFL